MAKDIFENAAKEVALVGSNSDEVIAKNRLANKKSVVEVEDSVETFNEQQNLSLHKSRRIPGENFKNIPITNLPSKGLYYPEDTTIHIKAAETKQIRHYSTMDERDYLNVDDKLNYILEQCCKVYMPNKITKGVTTYKDLFEYDRIYLILAIKELTFLEDDNTISMNVECPLCGHKESVGIAKESIPQLELPEQITKYWNPENLSFDFKTKDGDEIKMKLPTLGVTSFTKNYVRAKSYNSQFIDESMMKTIMYLDYDHNKLNDKSIKEIDLEMIRWSKKKISLVDKLISMFDELMAMKIVHNCSGCGEETAHDIQFQKGYKSLFLFSDILDELV